LNTRDLGVQQEAQARGSSDDVFGVVERNDATNEPVSRTVSTEDLLSAMLSSRDLSPGQEIETRGFLSDAFDIGVGVLGMFLRRDVAPGQLAARDGSEDFLKSIMGSRDLNPSDGFAKVINALASSRRDDASDELAARGDWEDFMGMLPTRE